MKVGLVTLSSVGYQMDVTIHAFQIILHLLNARKLPREFQICHCKKRVEDSLGRDMMSDFKLPFTISFQAVIGPKNTDIAFED